MATVKVIQKRQQSSSFALYRTSVGGDESIIVRRKVGDPTDYLHTKSRKLIKQRANLSLASHHYSQLTPSQKAITRHQFEEVEYQKSHGKTDTKLLMGRQLFISKEMHSLETAQKQLILPLELCIMLVDENKLPLEGELWLSYQSGENWLYATKEQLDPGNWLFSQTPRDMPAYHPYGEADGYLDLELPEHQAMTQDEIRAYHYHVLYPYVPILQYVGDNTHAFACTEGWRAAQTFALSDISTFKGVVLRCYLFDPDHDGTLYISLYETTGGIPSGAKLTEGERRLSTLTSEAKDLVIYADPLFLPPSIEYAIVANVVMDKPYPHTDSLRINLLDEHYPHLPHRGLRSYQLTGNEWYPFSYDYSFWMILLG